MDEVTLLLCVCFFLSPRRPFRCLNPAHMNFSDMALFAPDRVRQTGGAGKMDSMTFNDQVGRQDVAALQEFRINYFGRLGDRNKFLVSWWVVLWSARKSHTYIYICIM